MLFASILIHKLCQNLCSTAKYRQSFLYALQHACQWLHKFGSERLQTSSCLIFHRYKHLAAYFTFAIFNYNFCLVTSNESIFLEVNEVKNFSVSLNLNILLQLKIFLNFPEISSKSKFSWCLINDAWNVLMLSMKEKILWKILLIKKCCYRKLFINWHDSKHVTLFVRLAVRWNFQHKQGVDENENELWKGWNNLLIEKHSWDG